MPPRAGGPRDEHSGIGCAGDRQPAQVVGLARMGRSCASTASNSSDEHAWRTLLATKSRDVTRPTIATIGNAESMTAAGSPCAASGASMDASSSRRICTVRHTTTTMRAPACAEHGQPTAPLRGQRDHDSPSTEPATWRSQGRPASPPEPGGRREHAQDERTERHHRRRASGPRRPSTTARRPQASRPGAHDRESAPKRLDGRPEAEVAQRPPFAFLLASNVERSSSVEHRVIPRGRKTSFTDSGSAAAEPRSVGEKRHHDRVCRARFQLLRDSQRGRYGMRAVRWRTGAGPSRTAQSAVVISVV